MTQSQAKLTISVIATDVKILSWSCAAVCFFSILVFPQINVQIYFLVYYHAPYQYVFFFSIGTILRGRRVILWKGSPYQEDGLPYACKEHATPPDCPIRRNLKPPRTWSVYMLIRWVSKPNIAFPRLLSLKYGVRNVRNLVRPSNFRHPFHISRLHEHARVRTPSLVPS